MKTGKWNTPLPDHVQKILSAQHGRKIKYRCPERIAYWSERYQKWVIVQYGRLSDGATMAIDINSIVWWVHDEVCLTGKWADGSDISNWQASMLTRDILWKEKRWIRAVTWRPATWLLGGGRARDNGMF